MIIVTGGAGFIGSNLVRALNISGQKDLLIVDDLSDGHKFQNIADCSISPGRMFRHNGMGWTYDAGQ